MCMKINTQGIHIPVVTVRRSLFRTILFSVVLWRFHFWSKNRGEGRNREGKGKAECGTESIQH
jgi:hypothetical protein